MYFEIKSILILILFLYLTKSQEIDFSCSKNLNKIDNIYHSWKILTRLNKTDNNTEQFPVNKGLKIDKVR